MGRVDQLWERALRVAAARNDYRRLEHLIESHGVDWS